MTLSKLKNNFRTGQLLKAEYIREMFQIHSQLFEYSEFIKSTDIESITITDAQVVVTSRKLGIKMICPPQDERSAPFELLNFDFYESDELEIMRRIIQPGSTIFDIGANYGWYAVALSKQLPDLKIHAFEPIPQTLSVLKKNIELNKLTNISLHHHGFSDQSGKVEFYYYKEGSGNASLENVSEKETVQVVPSDVETLDAFLTQHPTSVDFIKCDVEGAELLVFRGGRESLAKYKPVIFTEMLRKWSAKFRYHPNDIIQFLAQLGYGCFAIQGAHLANFSRMTDESIETNFFFLHLKKHDWLIQQLVPSVVNSERLR